MGRALSRHYGFDRDGADPLPVPDGRRPVGDPGHADADGRERLMALDWYFLRVQVGREDRIRESMVRRLKQGGIENLVPQIVVPTETIADHRQGKKTVKRRKLYPGYLMVQMDLSDEVWFVLRETPGF